MESRKFLYPKPFKLESGKELPSIEIAYHISGDPSDNNPIVWICHALTANSNPIEWWSGITGPGKIIDTTRYTVICANMLGSCYGSTGPASPAPDGSPYLLRFPSLTVRDTVKAHYLLTEHLGIKKIALMTGASIGGFQALEWSIMYPSLISRLLLIACNAQVTPWGAAFNESQRMAIETDPSFLRQEGIKGGAKGIEAARSIALLSYRSYRGYNTTQQEETRDFLFATRACTYQNYQGRKLSDRFNAYSYHTLTKMVDSHNTGRGRGGIINALSIIDADTTIIGIDSDMLFPPEEQLFMKKHIRNSRFKMIESEYGHDGFLLEYKSIKQIIEKHIKL
jgi:homoserine O-acetyltransferase/O-succinyltransferase